MSRTRVLFVDDENNIRLTLPAILEMHGYDVTVAADVPEALSHIQQRTFDVLITDLNIGQPGDGFTVVSAMRRTQPEAVTIIITGYPAFETALQAIRKQVDDYVVKPTDVGQLVRVIERRLHERQPRREPPLRRVAEIIAENRDAVVEDWLAIVESSPDLAEIRLDRGERVDDLPVVLDRLVDQLKTGAHDLTEPAARAASEHGEHRGQQGYTHQQLLLEGRILRKVLQRLIQRHLISVDISHLMSDLIALSEFLDQVFERSSAAFLHAEPKAA